MIIQAFTEVTELLQVFVDIASTEICYIDTIYPEFQQ